MNKHDHPILRNRQEQGATVVEFAVVVVPLLIIVFGIIEFGIIFMQIHLVENAAREGMRRGVVADTYNCWQSGDPVPEGQTCFPRRQTVEQAVREYLASLYEENKISVDVENSLTGDTKQLRVEVAVENFMPKILSALIPLDSLRRETITYTVTGQYEDSNEP